jgi:purine-binding chemotaxis protein CheW
MEKNKLKRNISYLSFHLGDEVFALHVSKVHKILEMTPITEVPHAPDYMKGVINLRGKVLPVIDTRIKFGMSAVEITKKTCLLVTEANVDEDEVMVCLLVDSVQAVLKLGDEDILPPPAIGSKYKSDFMSGMARVNDKFIMVLDIDKVMSSDELLSIKEIKNVINKNEQEPVEK